MEEQENQPKRRLEKRSGKTFFMIFCTISILLLTAIFYFYPQQDKSVESVVVDNQLSSSAVEQIPDQQSEKDTALPAVESVTTPDPETSIQTVSLPVVKEHVPTQPDQTSGNIEDQPTVPVGIAPPPKKDKSPCNPYLDNLEYFFDVLDNRTYIQNFKLNQKSNLYFPNLIQRLVDNPPVVTGETDDLYTVLQNTAHFFRIIGKKNILILKGILDREKATFEETLADFYHLTQHPNCLKERFELQINDEALYLYSGFFLNTMGGRLYLFRRDSMSRMVVNFYAILIMDQATRKGKNKYGIALNSPIDSLIDEIESSKIELQLRDFYLDSLYDMKEKYQ